MKFSPKEKSELGMFITVMGSFANFWIGKGPIFSPKIDLGKSLLNGTLANSVDLVEMPIFRDWFGLLFKFPVNSYGHIETIR